VHTPSKLVRALLAAAALPIATLSALAADVSIADFGALKDGKTVNTAAIQAAVDACAAGGGGTVLVPPGIWVSGGIELKSHVTLRLEPGAVLRGSSKLSDYPPNPFKHPEMGETRSLLWAIGRSDVSITGEGAIELTDRPFFDWNRLRTGLPADEDALLQDWQRAQCVVTALARPTQPIFFHECMHLRLEGVTIRNSPCWTVTFSCSRDIQVRGVRVENNFQVPNNDGMHFSGSRNIVVSDCIIRGGDDALAFTGITNPDSVCENIVVNNCILTSRSAGVRLGHLSGKVRDVTLTNLVIRDSGRGFAIQAGDHGWVENVEISNVVVETRMFAGAWWGKGEPLVISAANSETAHIRGITISHLRARAENGILIVGQNHNVEDVTLDDVSLELGGSANSPLYGRMLDLAPAPLRPSLLSAGRMPWLYADDVSRLTLDNIVFRLRDGGKQAYVLDPVIRNVSGLRSQGG
jgi:polygalacturonase